MASVVEAHLSVRIILLALFLDCAHELTRLVAQNVMVFVCVSVVQSREGMN